jgi:hypothetical protein
VHAAIVRSNVDMARVGEALAGIDAVKTRLKGMRGFRGGYWLQPLDGQGMAVLLWDDEEAARAAAFPIGSSPEPNGRGPSLSPCTHQAGLATGLSRPGAGSTCFPRLAGHP